MDQQLIGEFISTKRKEKGLTQKELADKLRISEKTISKWETGHGLPEVSNMPPLCKELDITVTELLNGKESKDTKPVIEYMEYKEKKTKKKLLITTLLLTLIILVILLGTYFYNSFNKITIYELGGESEHFVYLDGLVMKSNIKQLLVTGQVDPINDYVEQEDITYIAIYSGDEIIIGSSRISFSANILEDYGYDEVLTDKKLKNIDNWYVLVKYTKDGKQQEEKIPIKNHISMKNNQLFLKKEKPIGTKEENPEELQRIENKAKELDEYYLSKGYKKTQLDEWFYEYEKKDNNTTINIKLETTAANAKYEYIDNKYEMNFYVGAQYYSFHDRDYKIFMYYWRKDNYLACYEGETKVECPSYIKEDLDKIINVLDKEFKEIIPSKEHWKSKE